MEQTIVDFHVDDEGDWVADLCCGHTRHVRHRPPWINRRWVTTEVGRRGMLGYPLWCKCCHDGEPVPDGSPAVRPAIPEWHVLDLGDALLAGPELDGVETAFRRVFHDAGKPENMALFVRHASAGQLHCSVIIYFTPAAEPVALEFGADPCAPPEPRGLGLLQGASEAWALLPLMPDSPD